MKVWYTKPEECFLGAGTSMKFEFINDLDDFFCEKYANYDKLCILDGYRMPRMQETKTDEFGRKYSYTLPAETMSLARQENKAELLQALKEKMYDKNFSFSFRPQKFFGRIADTLAKQNFRKVLKEIAARHSVNTEEMGAGLDIDPTIWKRVLKGEFYPSKNLILALGISAHLTYRDVKELLNVSGYDFEMDNVRDVVVSYLLIKGIYNQAMVAAALEEYRLQPMMMKSGEENA